MKERIEFIDLAKGICILLVVMLHTFGELSGEFIHITGFFRMPLYFILSGLFFKTYDGFFPFLRKKTNKLIIPFLSAYLVGVLSIFLLNKDFYAGNGRLGLGLEGACWFLLCLFWVNSLFNLLYYVCKSNIYLLGVLCLAGGFAGYYLSQKDLFLPIWIDSALTALPFFYFGYILRNKSKILNREFTLKNLLLMISCCAILLTVYYVEAVRQNHSLLVWGENNFNISSVGLYVSGVCGTMTILMISKYFNHIPVISFIGRYSIVVLLTHLLILFVLRNAMFQFEIDQTNILINLAVLVTVVIIEIPVIKVCVKYLPYCFAQKDLI